MSARASVGWTRRQFSARRDARWPSPPVRPGRRCNITHLDDLGEVGSVGDRSRVQVTVESLGEELRAIVRVSCSTCKSLVLPTRPPRGFPRCGEGEQRSASRFGTLGLDRGRRRCSKRGRAGLQNLRYRLREDPSALEEGVSFKDQDVLTGSPQRRSRERPNEEHGRHRRRGRIGKGETRVTTHLSSVVLAGDEDLLLVDEAGHWSARERSAPAEECAGFASGS